MADTFKILGQVAPGATTETDLYVVPAETSTVISSIFVCERGGGTPTFRIAVRPKSQVVGNEHYLYYGTALTANQTLGVVAGITLGAGDCIMVYASTADTSFSVFGSETKRS